MTALLLRVPETLRNDSRDFIGLVHIPSRKTRTRKKNPVKKKKHRHPEQQCRSCWGCRWYCRCCWYRRCPLLWWPLRGVHVVGAVANFDVLLVLLSFYVGVRRALLFHFRCSNHSS
ncbi:unnamed protein product [Pylaiella littoralis]